MRATMSSSKTANSSSVISPSSTRICAARSCSRSAVSSFSSVSAAAATLSSTNRMLPIKRESRMNIASMRPLELQPDVDEVVGRPRAGVLERQLLVLLADFLDARVERLFLVARDEERRVHDHPVADRLVRSRRDRDVAQRAEDPGDVALGPRLQRRVDQAAVLHAREVRRALLRADLALEAADVLVLVLDLPDNLIPVPQDLQTELELVLHLAQHVAERVVGRAQQLDDVVVGL